MKIALKGKQVYLAGKIQGMSRDDVVARVAQFGGTLVSGARPKKGMDIMLAGMNASQGKTHLAMALGIPIISHEHAITLLDEGGLEIDPEQGKKPFDELIGPIRALLSERFSEKSWFGLCKMVDSCREADMPKLLAYLEPQLEARAAHYLEHGVVYDERRDYDFINCELQPFPWTWMGEAMNGATHPKFRLCKMLTFTAFFAGSTPVSRTFDGDGFSHITLFDMGYVNEEDKKKKSFFKKMCKATNMANVHTLILGTCRDFVVEELLNARNMPQVTSIYLRPDMWFGRAPDQGGGLFFGPWAPQLHTIGVTYPAQLDLVATRLDELPELKRLVLWCRDTKEESLLTVLDRIDRLTITVDSLDAPADRERLGEMLDLIAQRDLEELTVHVAGGEALGKDASALLADAHFIGNGLADRLGKLVLHGQMDRDVIADVRTRGLDVQLPVAFEIAPTSVEKATIEHVEQVPDGEEERRASRQLVVQDAMLYDTPCGDAWDVLVGVVDALEIQLGRAEFDEAIASLCTYLEPWPDELRVMPKHWFGKLFDEQPDPRLALVRCLEVSLSESFRKKAMKAHGRWVERLSRALQIAHFGTLHITGLGELKHLHKTAATLIEQVDAGTVMVAASDEVKGALRDLLAAKKIDALLEPSERPPKSPEVTTIEERQSRHVVHKVHSAEELEALLQIQDLDHVVSLTVIVNFMAPINNMPGPLSVSPASFESLRHLEIRYQGKNHKGDNVFHRALIEWLAHARPVYIHNPFFTQQAVDVGLYERAYHARASFHEDSTREELLTAVSDSKFIASEIGFENYYGRVELRLSEFIDACHDTLARNLRVLRWPATVEDLQRADEELTDLPNLSTFALVVSDMHFEARRAPYLDALAGLTHFHKLARMELYAKSHGIPEPFKAAEIKALRKLPGAPGDMLTQEPRC